MTKILLVDDEQLAIDLLKSKLERLEYSVDTASNGLDALGCIDESYSVLVTDIVMPQMDGTTLLAEVKKRFANIIVIAVTSFADKERAIAVLNAGADFLLEKPFTAQVLADIIERLIDEHKDHVKDHIAGAFHAQLSRFDINDNDRRMIQMLVQGMANKQIAYELGIKEQTVKNRMSHIFKKLGISGRSDLFPLLFPI